MKKHTALLLAFFCVYFCMEVSAKPADLIYYDDVKVPIVMYHKLTKNEKLLNKWIITPEEFEQDLIFFKEHGFETIVMSDLIDFVNTGCCLPDKPIILTFDDGDTSIYRYALPLLEKYEMKAVVSIIGEPTDKYSNENRDDIKYYPHLTWGQIKELVESGFIELQNHSYNMHRSRGVLKNSGESAEQYRTRFSKDIGSLQTRIFDNTGMKANTFVYPFGLCSELSDEILKEMGFSASLSCYDRINTIKFGEPGCLFGLGRTLRPHGSSPAKLFKKFL